ncbi:Ger(x)C family spore germination protein [Salibacterium aidingense]|uniref:Ger(x)C family spore germination protein n=1 Tax=Salibacterium aidingense TaxID=384933 RepID=UPI003BE70803
MMIKGLLCFFSMLLSISILSGCWSNQELPDLALVSAIGIDLSEDGEFVNTIQVINPGNVAGEGMQNTGGSESPPVSIYTEHGYNMTEAQRRISKKVSRELYYAHTNLLVIGEKLAEERGIQEIFDALERDNEFRTTTKVVVAQDAKAEEIIKTLTSIDKIPANKVIKTLRSTERIWGENINLETRDLLQKLISPGTSPVISCFRAPGNEDKGEAIEGIQETQPPFRLQAAGLALFKDGKLIHTVDGDTSKGILWVLDKIKETGVSLDWKQNKEAIVYEVIRQKTSVSAQVKNNQPKVSVEVSAEGDIGETSVPIDLRKPHVLKDLEGLVEKEIKANLLSSIKKTQELQTDVLGFGEAVHRADSEAWKEMKKNWNDEYFPEVEVDVKVNAFIRRTGLRNKPFLLDF